MTILCMWKAEVLNCMYYIGSSTMMIGRKETRLDENDQSQWHVASGSEGGEQ